MARLYRVGVEVRPSRRLAQRSRHCRRRAHPRQRRRAGGKPENASRSRARPRPQKPRGPRLVLRHPHRIHRSLVRAGKPLPSPRRTPRIARMKPTVTLHLVSSLDGFIAAKDHSVAWMDSDVVYEKGVTGNDSAEVLQSIDCYVLGSRTYEHALELGWPYGDTPTVVVTGREWPPARKSVEFYSGELKTLVHVKLAPRFRNIWL